MTAQPDRSGRARLAVRILLVVGTFLGAGYLTMHLLIARAVADGTPEYSVRLAGAMAGLFVGGIAASLIALIFLLGGRRAPAEQDHTD